jgi:hypothetical protein
MKNKKLLYIIVLIGVAVLAGLLWQSSYPMEVASIQVQRGSISIKVEDTAVVQAAQDYDLYATQNAQVKNIQVEIGQEVEADTLLMELDNPTLQLQLSENQSLLAQTQASANAAAAAVKRMELQHQDAAANLTRSQELFDKGAISVSEYEQALLNMQTAKQAWEEQKSHLNTLQSQLKGLNDSREKLLRMEKELKVFSPVQGVVLELQTQTRIYKFRLQDGIKYQAKGQVPGTVLNQFALDEYQDHLRIATTTQEWSSTHSQNSVYILNPELKVLSSITGIAPGERIYSTRFLQDRLYMVTFRQVDPFFVIDLNPQNPKVLGQLKIPGFSKYLHPYGDHYVIGLGYDTSLNKSGGVIQGGIKLSLYDVEDVSQPREVDTSISGDSGSYSEACENHRAFLLHHDLLAFPAQIYTERSPGNSYSSFEFQGAYIYTVSEQGFDYQGRITHLSPEDYLKAGDYWYDMNKTVRRIVVIDNNIYSISQGGIKANDKSTLKEIKHISI